MLILNKILFHVFFIFPFCALANTATQDLELKLQHLNSMQADFRQVLQTHGKSHAKAQQSVGKMALERPGKFRWQIQSPSKQLIVADGKNLWIYDVDLEQVTRHEINYQDADNPALLLSGSPEILEKMFIISRITSDANQVKFTGKGFKGRQEVDDLSLKNSSKINALPGNNIEIPNNQDIFELRPRSENAMYDSIRLYFIANELSEMQIKNNLGQESILYFTNITTNGNLSEQLFKFKAPHGVDVIRE